MWKKYLKYVYTFSQKYRYARDRDANRGSKNRNSLQIRELEIEFSNSKLNITFCISAQAVTQGARDRASRFCANGQTRHNGPPCPLNRDAAAKVDGQFAICDERGGGSIHGMS